MSNSTAPLCNIQHHTISWTFTPHRDAVHKYGQNGCLAYADINKNEVQDLCRAFLFKSVSAKNSTIYHVRDNTGRLFNNASDLLELVGNTQNFFLCLYVCVCVCGDNFPLKHNRLSGFTSDNNGLN